MRSLRNSLPAMLFALLLMGKPVSAGDFSFYSTLRAGRPAGGDWELGLGSNIFASQSTGSFQWGVGNPHWRSGNLPQKFEIGFSGGSQSAYITVWDEANSPQTVQFLNSGTPLGRQAVWTLPASNFFVSASSVNQPSSIDVENLTLSPGVQVLSGSLPTSLGASQPLASSSAMSDPLVFNPASNGGDWYIAGTIRFAGLVSTGGSARGSSLQFFLRAMGPDTPEGGTFLMAGVGLFLLGFVGRNRGNS